MTAYRKKEAQRRSIMRGLKRTLNPMEQARYHAQSLTGNRNLGAYKKIYDAIDKVDKGMRKKALRSKPGIKKSLHLARMAFKRREFPKVVFHAMNILKSVDGVFEDVSKLYEIRDNFFGEFYGTHTKLKDDQLRQMQETLGKKPESKNPEPKQGELRRLLFTGPVPDPELVTKASFDKEAGPMEWIKENMPSMKGMQFDLIDRIFKNKAEKQRLAAEEALDLAEDAYKSITEVFDDLDANLTNFSEYVSIAETAQKTMDQHLNKLRGIYQANFADIVPTMEKTNDDAEGAEEPAKGKGEESEGEGEGSLQEGGVQVPVQRAPLPAPPPRPEGQPTGYVPESQLGGESVQSEINVPEVQPPQTIDVTWSESFNDEEEAPVTQRSPQMPVAAKRSIEGLVKKAEYELSRGNTGIAGTLLVKASEICDNYDDEKGSIALLTAASRILQG